ncbi:hypothetical protein K402DRAFT_193801 [Aulographum hederae CBS 113979]|uniref:BTB domain-containing protein n=1 Tax=Aulographum hederae CBS 113979 TaxID=1176131 RepID=A0A6G1GNN4_9PEZI|nr:hypothetical protein K402DRAFT_193801 [Aulographum hederae CBS 113979]
MTTPSGTFLPIRAAGKKMNPYFDKADFSDATVKYGDVSLPVHRVILCGGSGFFKKAFSGGFAEAQSCEVTLHDDEPILVRTMIIFLYSFVMNVGLAAKILKTYERPEGIAPLMARLYGIADKYDVPRLKIASAEVFKHEITKITSATNTQIPLSIEAVYTTTPSSDRVLREILVKACLGPLRAALRKEKDTNIYAEFDKQRRAHPDFSVDLLDGVFQDYTIMEAKPSDVRVVSCETCEIAMGHWMGSFVIFGGGVPVCANCYRHDGFSTSEAT